VTDQAKPLTTEAHPNSKTEKKGFSLAFLKPYLAPYKMHLILGPMAKLVEAVLELLTPLLMAKVIDGALSNRDNPGFFKAWGGGLLGLVLTSLIFSFTCQYLASKASQGVGTDLRQAVFEKIQGFSFAQLDKFGSSSLINRLGIDIMRVQYTVAMFIRLYFRAPFLAIGGAVMAFSISPKIAGLLVLAIILAAFILWFIVRLSMKPIRKAQDGLDSLNRIVADHFSGVRIIRAFNRSEHERHYFSKKNDDVNAYLEKAGRISAWMNPATVIVVNLAIILALYWGGGLVSTGNILPGQMIALINYFSQVLLAMTVTANLALAIPKTVNSLERLEDVLEEEEDLRVLSPEEAALSRGETKLPAKASLIDVQDLSFSYTQQGRAVLSDLNFSIEEGAFIGLIGSTGSGKSTLVRLLQRFYDPDRGVIFLDGADLRTMTRAEIQAHIAFVPQKAQLFSGTVRSNLTMGLDADLDDAVLWEALDSAMAKDFVSAHPLGLDRPVERDGKNFSGGQRQRLTIARALVRKTPILILDDSLSALDYKTERQVMRHLRADTENRTLILVSQRIHSIKKADRILVLEEGKLMGQGSHKELIEINPIYQEIQASQLTPDEEEV
jgi:ATP-binding cassette subfamily B multidrug efflux pump